MGNSVAVFGFVWKWLEIFDLDGHNLGTIKLNYGPGEPSEGHHRRHE